MSTFMKKLSELKGNKRGISNTVVGIAMLGIALALLAAYMVFVQGAVSSADIGNVTVGEHTGTPSDVASEAAEGARAAIDDLA